MQLEMAGFVSAGVKRLAHRACCPIRNQNRTLKSAIEPEGAFHVSNENQSLY
jgi:hypothetical protein